MADSENFQGGDHLVATEGTNSTTIASFSQLLFSNDDDVDLDLDTGGHHHHHHHPFYCYSCSVEKPPPKMLCFGQNESEFVLFSENHQAMKTAPQLSGVTCSDSSSASSGNNNINKGTVNANSNVSKSNRRRNGLREELVPCNSSIAKTRQRNNKKTKTENPTSTGHGKVRKEKLGERINVLQQLVSPFGKTDTASVLHEAMGYIRFLHDQVQVLCSPYLHHHHHHHHHHHQLPEGKENGEESRKDLRSRGLCLVPVESSVHLASSSNIGADFWSPAMGNLFSSLSTTKQ